LARDVSNARGSRSALPISRRGSIDTYAAVMAFVPEPDGGGPTARAPAWDAAAARAAAEAHVPPSALEPTTSPAKTSSKADHARARRDLGSSGAQSERSSSRTSTAGAGSGNMRQSTHQYSTPATYQSTNWDALPAVETAEPTQHKYEYDAFVSYRRRDATRLAQWIRSKLQRFRLPPEILRELPREKQNLYSRRPQIWLDTSYEKPSDDFLIKKVFPALDKSARLIVVSTPAALERITKKDGKAEDNWLVREIDHFLGEVHFDETDRPVDVVFGPGAIEGRYPGRLSEKPRWDWIDLRSFSAWRARAFSDTLDDGLAKLVAALYDVPDRFLPLLRREERRRRHRTIVGFAVAGFSIAALTTAIMIWGLMQRADALSSLNRALVTQARLSVRLAIEELQKKDPEKALATALAGVETSSQANTDKAVIPETITAIANSMANETFGATLHEHSDAVLKVFLGAGGRSVITVGADERVVLWGGEDGYPLRPTASTTLVGSVFAVAPTGGLIASASPTGQIHFWKSSAPELSPKPFDFGETLVMLAFSDDGQQIAALGTAGRLAVWDVAKNSRVWSAPSPVRDASIIVLGSCSCLAVGALSGDLLAWSFDHMDPVLVRGASGRIMNGSFGRDGEFIFTTDDGGLWITSAPSWPTPVRIGQHDGIITGFAIAPGGRLAATTTIDGVARVWDMVQRLELNKYKPITDAAVSSVTFSLDGNAIALGYGDGTVAIFDISAARPDTLAALVMRGHAGAVLDLSFSLDGNWLASASLDRTARLWQLQTARRPRMQQAHEGAAFHAVSKNGRYLVSGGRADKKIRLWTGPNWEPGKSIVLDNEPRALAISDDGKRAFIGTELGDLLQWDTSGSEVRSFSRGNGVISAIAVSPNGKTLAAIGVEAKKLQVCSLVFSPPKCETISALGGWGYSVAFSEDGRWMGATSGVEAETGLALVWDLNANKFSLLRGHDDRVLSIRFDRSGERAVTASWDGTARIWDLHSDKELVRLVEPKGRKSTAGFSPNGEWVATSSYDKTLRLWEVPKIVDPNQAVIMETGKSVLSDTIGLGQVEFGLGGDILAASMSNGEIHLWQVPDGTLRAVLEGDGSAIRSMYFQPDGVQITGMTSNGRLISWKVPSALGLGDDLLLSAARSMLPLPGSLAGKPEELSTTRSATSETCKFPHERNLGLPPHNLSGAARARQRVRSCNSNLTRNAKTLLAGVIAATEGDVVTARQKFTTASNDGDLSAEIGLGDLGFVDSLSSADGPNAFDHYTKARAQGIPHAVSRLGWLLLANGADGAAQAKRYFEEASNRGDADGFAGLAWIKERFGKSYQDLEAAFANYTKAQYQYERDGDLGLAQEVAERRAMLARLMPPKRIPNLFLSTRSSITSFKGTN